MTRWYFGLRNNCWSWPDRFKCNTEHLARLQSQHNSSTNSHCGWWCQDANCNNPDLDITISYTSADLSLWVSAYRKSMRTGASLISRSRKSKYSSPVIVVLSRHWSTAHPQQAMCRRGTATSSRTTWNIYSNVLLRGVDLHLYKRSAKVSLTTIPANYLPVHLDYILDLNFLKCMSSIVMTERCFTPQSGMQVFTSDYWYPTLFYRTPWYSCTSAGLRDIVELLQASVI